uniref:Nucleoporin Nup54 alpha-helical domain-containing protein n=1 Tax=Haptolina ericina TaxID=156174 RepID=A0A7S3F9W1_9EUKA
MFDDLSEEGQNMQMRPPPADVLHKKRAENRHGSDAVLWDRADAQNPDPSRFVPVQITGFEALQERRMRMEHMAGQIAQLLEQTRTKVADMERERQVTFNLNLRHYRSRQQHLRHRVVRLAGAFERQHLLRSTGGIEPRLQDSEVQYIRKLQKLAEEVEDPATGFDRLYEATDRLAEIESSNVPGEMAAPGDGLARRIDLTALEAWVARHQDAILKLIDVQRADLKDVKLILAEASRGR